MRAVTEGFILALTATAKADSSPSGEIEWIAVGIDDQKVIAFDTERAIVVDSDSGGHRFSLRARRPALFSFFGCFDGVEILGLASLLEGIGEGLTIVIGGSFVDPVLEVDGIVEGSEYRKVMMTFRTENVVALDGGHDCYLLQNDLVQDIVIYCS